MNKTIIGIAGVVMAGTAIFFLLSSQGARERIQSPAASKAKKEPYDAGRSITLSETLVDSSIVIEAPTETLSEPALNLPETATIRIRNVPFSVEVADSPDIQMKGLTGRESIPDNSGMMYVLTSPVQYKYWAKDMKFATDVLWIGSDFVIKDIFEDIRPDSYPKQYVSEHATQYVLELKSGAAARAGIKVGDSADLSELFKDLSTEK